MNHCAQIEPDSQLPCVQQFGHAGMHETAPFLQSSVGVMPRWWWTMDVVDGLPVSHELADAIRKIIRDAERAACDTMIDALEADGSERGQADLLWALRDRLYPEKP